MQREDYMDFKYDKLMGQQIKRAREKKGWSQEQLAAKMQLRGLDITRSALAKIEVGQRHIYAEEIKAFKEILKIRYEDLFR